MMTDGSQTELGAGILKMDLLKAKSNLTGGGGFEALPNFKVE